MLRTKILNLPLPYYRPEGEEGSNEDNEKTPAQKERDNIKVTSSTTKQDEEDADNKAKDDKVDLEEENEVEEEEEVNNEEKNDTNEEELKELTEDQKSIKALEKKLERAQRRAGKTAAERDENKNKVKELQAALDAKLAEGTQPLTEEEVNRRARQMAEGELTIREFEAAQETLIEDAIKIDKTFMSKIRDLAEEVAPLPQFFIGALNELDHKNGGAVLNYLTDNPDDYEEILKNAKKPTLMLTKLIRISDKLNEETKPKPKKISGAPPPPKVPKGGNKTPDLLPPDPTKDMENFVRVRNRQEREKRENRNR